MYNASLLSPAQIELRNLVYEAQGKILLDIADLCLGDSGITVVMGPNGAGKSLLLRLMHNLLPPTQGQILCRGKALSAQIARKQALVLQTPVLLRRTTEANVRFVLKVRGKPLSKAQALLKLVDLDDLAKTPARRLSGGERQRLAIAQALATDPDVLFLDEPTASLDPSSIQSIERIVRRTAAYGVRIVFVTHDAAQARRLADDVVFLSGGRVLEHTPADRFFDEPVTRAARDYLDGRLLS